MIPDSIGINGMDLAYNSMPVDQVMPRSKFDKPPMGPHHAQRDGGSRFKARQQINVDSMDADGSVGESYVYSTGQGTTQQQYRVDGDSI